MNGSGGTMARRQDEDSGETVGRNPAHLCTALELDEPGRLDEIPERARSVLPKRIPNVGRAPIVAGIIVAAVLIEVRKAIDGYEKRQRWLLQYPHLGDVARRPWITRRARIAFGSRSPLRARIAFGSRSPLRARIAFGSRITLGPHQAELGDVDGCFLLPARFPKHDRARLLHTQHHRLNRRSHEHRHGDRHDMSQTLPVHGSPWGTIAYRAPATLVETKARS